MKYHHPQRRQTRRSSHMGRVIGSTMRSTQSRYRARAQMLLDNFTAADPMKRLIAMMTIVSAVIILFVIRLFYLQVLNGQEYLAQAQEQQFGKVVIPAKRGEIFTENPKTGQRNLLATNTTQDLVYIDPQEVPDKEMVAKALAPILFDQEDFLACKQDIKNCPSGGVKFEEAQTLVSSAKEASQPVILKDTRTREELVKAYERDLLEKISKTEVDYAPLMYGANDFVMDEVEELQIYGVTVLRNKNLIYADPTKIDQTRIQEQASKLSLALARNQDEIESLLTRRSVRYVPLKRRLSPEASDAIWKLKKESYENYRKDSLTVPHYYKGVVLIPEHWRYYPEKELASTVIGYVDHEGYGNYGIEEYFQNQLQGKNGVLWSKNDVNGAQLVFDAEKMEEVEDGDSLVLTIDRVIQSKVQELLSSAVERYNADTGSIIVMEPFSGDILAMGNYPNFDPNNFGEVYQLQETKEEDWKVEDGRVNKIIYDTQPIFIKNEKGDFEEVNRTWLREEYEAIEAAKEKVRLGIKEFDEEGNEIPVVVPEPTTKYVYKNRFGLGAYVNHNVMRVYEPGSVFKPVAMAVGLDTGEVDPLETYEEYGPIEIDTGTGKKQYIRTALNKYRGIQTMTNAIEQSSNIGMAYVARKLGRSLFYKYILDFGFADYTYIPLAGEQRGKVSFWKDWTEATLLTSSFGQGLTVTPLQMITSWAALANGGVLMEPKIVDTVIHPDGTEEKVESQVIRRIVSEETSQKISAMLVSSVEKGVASPGKVDGYRVAGKTGTSQIACSDSHRCKIGTYEDGEGTTITSFAGYGPINKPKFVVLVKFERPKIGDNTWGSTTAAPVFRDLVEFLYQYYDVPPDDL